MELIGMLRQFASWQFLLVIAGLDVCFILLQLTSPAPGPLPSLLPSLRAPPHPHAPHPSQDARHSELLRRVQEEKGRLGEEMARRVREMRVLTKTLSLKAEVLTSLNDSIGRLEDSIKWLQAGEGSARRVKVGIKDD